MEFWKYFTTVLALSYRFLTILKYIQINLRQVTNHGDKLNIPVSRLKPENKL